MQNQTCILSLSLLSLLLLPSLTLFFASPRHGCHGWNNFTRHRKLYALPSAAKRVIVCVSIFEIGFAWLTNYKRISRRAFLRVDRNRRKFTFVEFAVGWSRKGSKKNGGKDEEARGEADTEKFHYVCGMYFFFAASFKSRRFRIFECLR